MVEVAGSFNGWHQWIKLDPQPSSVMVDPVESRSVILANLFLYVKLDPQPSSVMD